MTPNETARRARRGGRLHLARRPVARAAAASGNLQELITDRQRRRGHHQPDDLRGRAGERRRPTTQQVRELAARGASVDDAVREITVGDVAHGLRRVPRHLGGHRRRRRPGLARGRPAAGPRHRRPPSPRPLDLWKAVDRPNLLVKIPATEAGLPAITARSAEGVSVNVTLIFSRRALPRGHGRLPRRAWSRPPRTATTWPASPRWRASSSPASTPRSTSGWRRSAPTRRWRCAARPASPTPGSPTRRSRRSSPGDALGRAGRAGRQGRNGRCGPRPA